MDARASQVAGSVLPSLRRLLVPALVAVALLVHLPVLGSPLFFDDYDQVAMLEGTYPSSPGPFNLYDFINDGNRHQLIERGILPWWADAHMELRFLRPLSSVLLWTDRHLFGSRVVFFAHLHSFLWWGLTCWALFALLRELFSRRVAVLGTFMYAIAPCHEFPLLWLANREALVSAALGTLALIHHARWRASAGSWRWREGLYALGIFSVAMLSGEYALCFGGYVLAIEVTRWREPWRRHALGVSTFAVPALAYLAARSALHYGATATGYYHDPLRDFGGYVEVLPQHLALLLSMAWSVVDERTWVNRPGWAVALLFAASVWLVAKPLARTLRSLDGTLRARTTWLILGSVISLAPLVAVGSSARLLEIPMMGVAAGLAVILDRTWFPPPGEVRQRDVEWAELMALGLAFLHLVRAPLDSWYAHRNLDRTSWNFERRVTWLHDKAEGKEMVIFLRANLLQTVFSTPLRLDASTPTRTLSFGSGRMLMLRTSEHTLELVATSEPLFPVGAEALPRNSDAPVHVGDTVTLTGMRATVVALREDGTPRRLRFDFDHDLDDPSYLWVTENEKGFWEVKLPPPGHGEPLKM